MTNSRKKIAVLFGGRSVEHEISIITALQLIEAMDTVVYEPIPVYVTTKGRWYVGDELLNRDFYKGLPGCLNELTEVILLPVPGKGGLTILSSGDEKKGLNLSSIFGKAEEKQPIVPVDVYLPAFHGSYGEDGCVQGLFEMADVAYVGCNVVSAAMGMNKYHAKMFIKSHDVPVLPSVLVKKEEIDPEKGGSLAKVKEKIHSVAGLEEFPLFIKPASLGSSIGLGKAADDKSLDAAIIEAFKYDSTLMVEPCMEEKMEINVSVLDGPEPSASVVEIPVAEEGEELTYEDKYVRGGGKKSGSVSEGMASLTRVIDPSDMDEETKKLARQHALTVFKALGCSGVARIDLMVDLKTNQIYFNEINTLPGSMSFYLWAKSDPCVIYTELISKIIERAEERHFTKSNLNREIGFKALFK